MTEENRIIHLFILILNHNEIWSARPDETLDGCQIHEKVNDLDLPGTILFTTAVLVMGNVDRVLVSHTIHHVSSDMDIKTAQAQFENDEFLRAITVVLKAIAASRGIENFIREDQQIKHRRLK